MVRNGYDLLIENISSLNQCRNIQKYIFEFSEFLVDVLKVDSIKGATLNGIATYHDSCSALRECGIKEAPRKLLKNVKGLKLVEMKDNETCCGFGGTFSVKFESISVAMAQQKVDHALAVNADYIISTDSSCLMHIDGYIKKNNIKIKTMHIADVLAPSSDGA
ncbi:MAG: (Fe-S)-binding protein [Bacteroidetes bacterium]|nr:(Fe-S)-binding protein [Bacteroidota bacterium]